MTLGFADRIQSKNFEDHHHETRSEMVAEQNDKQNELRGAEPLTVVGRVPLDAIAIRMHGLNPPFRIKAACSGSGVRFDAEHCPEFWMELSEHDLELMLSRIRAARDVPRDEDS